MQIEWNKVTWYSKLIAVIVFLITAALFFWLGNIYGASTEEISLGSSNFVAPSRLPLMMSSSSTNTLASITEPQNTSTSSSQTSWNIYTNTKYNYSLQYPDNAQYSIFAVSPTDPRGILFTIGTTTVWDMGADSGSSILFLQLVANPSSSTLDQWINQETESSGPTNISVLTEQSTTIDGVPAKKILFSTGLNTGQFNWLSIYFAYNGIIYRISGARVPSGNWADWGARDMQQQPSTTIAILNYQPIFDQMVQSFHFLKSTTPTTSVTTTTLFTSSSSAQVGDFTVVADCDVSENVFKIEIFKNGSSTQIINPYTQLASGGGSCPIPQVKDINSDGYPDFSVVYNYGNQYADSIYWLYNSSTNQFSCPNVKPNGKPWMACNLVEPY